MPNLPVSRILPMQSWGASTTVVCLLRSFTIPDVYDRGGMSHNELRGAHCRNTGFQMNRDFRRRGWSRDRFPMNLVRGFTAFLGRIRFWLSWPFRALLADRSRLKEHRPGILRRITMPFLWIAAAVLYSIANAGELVVGWSRSRHSRALMYGAPALVSIVMFASVIIYLMNIRTGGLINTYLLRATKSEKVERFDTARMYYQKLLQLDRSNQTYEFLIARSFDEEGNVDEATRRMAKLRNRPDVSGVVNFWFAKKTLEREDLDNEQKWKRALVHLEAFLKGAPRHFEANLLALDVNSKLANYYLGKREPDDAIDYLIQAERHGKILAEIAPANLLALARVQRKLSELYSQVGDSSRASEYVSAANRTAFKSIQRFSADAKENPRNIETLLRLADSYVFQKRFSDAIRQVDIAIRNDLSGRVSRQLTEFKSRIISAWAADQLKQGTRNLTQCIDLLDKAIQFDPKNEQALELLAQISIINNDEVSLTAKQKLDQAIANASAPFSVHLILGNYAASQQNDDLAVKHLRQALLLNRRAPAVMNNLAFVLARMGKPRYEEALALVNNALKIVPNNPHFLETRGMIYMKMKQYELAFHDFESAEINMKNNRTLYKNLLFLAQELGFDDIYRQKYEKRLRLLGDAENEEK